jgi:hypothetical protein
MTRKSLIHHMALDAWGAGAAVLTLLLLLEAGETGFVSRFFNVAWLAAFVLAAGLAAALTHPKSGEPEAVKPVVARALLQFASVAAALFGWLALDGLPVAWRALAAGGILLVALFGVPAFTKED